MICDEEGLPKPLLGNGLQRLLENRWHCGTLVDAKGWSTGARCGCDNGGNGDRRRWMVKEGRRDGLLGAKRSTETDKTVGTKGGRKKKGKTALLGMFAAKRVQSVIAGGRKREEYAESTELWDGDEGNYAVEDEGDEK